MSTPFSWERRAEKWYPGTINTTIRSYRRVLIGFFSRQIYSYVHGSTWYLVHKYILRSIYTPKYVYSVPGMFFAYGGGYIKEIRNFRQKINRQRLVGREHVCVCVCAKTIITWCVQTIRIYDLQKTAWIFIWTFVRKTCTRSNRFVLSTIRTIITWYILYVVLSICVCNLRSGLVILTR